MGFGGLDSKLSECVMNATRGRNFTRNPASGVSSVIFTRYLSTTSMLLMELKLPRRRDLVFGSRKWS